MGHGYKSNAMGWDIQYVHRNMDIYIYIYVTEIQWGINGELIYIYIYIYTIIYTHNTPLMSK